MEDWARTAETHRSPVVARRGMVASSQPLASEAGMRILRCGGNAADASIAVAAVLAVTEPCSTGLGGDCFALHFSAASGRVEAMNGSGRTPSTLTIDEARSVAPAMARSLPNLHAHAVTVPGAAAGWCETLERWGSGRVTLADVLRPAIELAEEGFPVSPLAAMQWAEGEAQLRSGPHFREMMLADGEGAYRAPRAGEIFRNLSLARVLNHLGAEGRAGFYEGWPAERIVELLQSKGSCMAASDMASHRTEFPDPISVCYHGVDVYEAPPNGQGITALVALNILEQLDPPLGSAARPWGSAEHLHPLIEALRLAFADARFFVADPAAVAGTEGSAAALLDKRYAAQRAALIQPTHANGRDAVAHGAPANSCNTVSFQVVDREGNAVSFVNSNYMGFGTGLVPRGCGFTLQNRGANFRIDDASHPNSLSGGKRPYHTIIPALALREGNLWATFTNMGGFMQPQGHVQLLVSMIDYGVEPQLAIERPRFCIDVEKDASREAGDAEAPCSAITLEPGFDDAVVERLRAMGHRIDVATWVASHGLYGRAQIIRRLHRPGYEGVLWGASDPRADGCAMGW